MAARISDDGGLADRLGRLSPTKRALLERRLSALADPPDARAPITAATGPDYPLSFTQRRVWLFEQIEPNTSTYSVPVHFRVLGPLDVQSLEDALACLVDRHAALRTTFHDSDAGPVQRIAENSSFSLERIDAHDDADALERLRSEAAHSFDLAAHSPLFRAVLIAISQTQHILLLATHHIVTDGWSLGVMLRELAELYSASRCGRSPRLSDLPVRFVDYVEWEIERAEHPEVLAQINHWANDLAGAPAVLPLPADRAKTGRPSSRGHVAPLSIPEATSERIAAFCRRHEVTPFAIYLAAWACTLHLNGAGDDIVVGVPFAGRNRKEATNLIGFFANTLGLRVRVSGEETFASLTLSARNMALYSMRLQEAPFEKIVEKLNPPRHLSCSPVFQTALAYLSSPIDRLELDGLRCEHLTSIPNASHFDTTLSIDEGTVGVDGRLALRSDLFERSTGERLVQCFLRILDEGCAQPDAPIAALRLFLGDERRHIIEQSSGAESPLPAEPIHRLFERQASKSPDHIAIVEGTGAVSYGELNRKADRIATALRRKGVPPGSIVAVLVGRSTDMISAILGVLKAGCAYLPMEENEPSQRLAEMLELADVSMVIARANIGDRPQLSLAQALAETPSGESSFPSPPDAPAYVMFTSGSTGKPKGVVIPHRGVVRLLFGADYARFSEDEVFLHMASPAFDASTFEIWGALLHGARCVVVPSQRPSVAEIGDVVAAQNVSTAWLTSSLFNVVIDENPEALRGLSQLLIGGEALSVSHVRRAIEALPNTRIINGYGPTECTTFAVCYAIPRDLPAHVSSIPIGRPIANTQAYILNRFLEPVPQGFPGELYLGGPGLAVGYLNDVELTRERFIQHPFRDDPRERLYRTGDLARWLPDGSVEFLGRRDTQVKVRGFRIELGEIEHHLLAHERVGQAVAAVREADIPGKQVVAYVVPTAGSTLTGAELTDFLQPKLPRFMIPSSCVILEALPLTPNGKVDRRALPEPPSRQSPSSQRPADELEAMVAEIWGQALGRDTVQAGDDFFDLGGHSLLAARVVSRIGKKIGRDFPIAALFEASTPRAMAALIREDRALDPLVAPVQSKGSLPPLFCVGMGPMYRLLATHSGGDRPILGVGLRSNHLALIEPPVTLEKLAQRLADELLLRFPSGPFILCGWCLEAILAYETARQLELRGLEVPLVVLFDPSDPERLSELSEPLHPMRLADRLWFHTKKLKDIAALDAPQYVARRTRELRNKWRRASRVAKQRRRNAQALPQLDKVGQAIYLAVCEYRPHVVNSPVAVIVPADSGPGHMRSVKASWGRLLGSSAAVYQTAGDHAGMFQEPHVHDLAGLVRDILPGPNLMSS